MDDAIERFAELVRQPERSLPLDEAALLIGAQARPDLDVAAELATLAELAASCPEPTLDGLRRHLFVDGGFAGDRQDYHDPRNSYLDQVLRRRLGIPISLSVLALSVGRRIGVPLDGVGMPGHFLLRDRVDTATFVDAFGGGAVLDAAGCERLFRAQHPEGTPFEASYLAPVGPRAILSRMLANLRATHRAHGAAEPLAWVLRLRATLPGTPAEERAELAGALVAMGDYIGAATELEGLAEVVGGARGSDYRRRAQSLRAALN